MWPESDIYQILTLSLTRWTEKSSTDLKRYTKKNFSRNTHANRAKVANKKQRDTAAGDAEMAAKRERAEAAAALEESGEVIGHSDILGEQGDEDIIF